MVILVSDKVDFKAKEIVKDKEGHFKKINGSIHSIHQEDITMLNIYATNNRALNTIGKNCQDDIEKSTIIIRDFIIPLSIIEKISRWKISNI